MNSFNIPNPIQMKANMHFLGSVTLYAVLFYLCISFAAFKPYNPCEFANNNILFIKEQAEQAIGATDIKMSRYYAYKALNGIWNAEFSFTECGCEDAISNMELAYGNLKEATKANAFEDSKVFLQIAIKNTRNSINALKEFKKSQSKYGSSTLTLNTKDSNAKVSEPAEKHDFSVDRLEAHLEKYQRSIDNVLKINDCERARKFITETQKKTETELMGPDLSQRKHYFHRRVLEITKVALQELEACSGDDLLAGK